MVAGGGGVGGGGGGGGGGSRGVSQGFQGFHRVGRRLQGLQRGSMVYPLHIGWIQGFGPSSQGGGIGSRLSQFQRRVGCLMMLIHYNWLQLDYFFT